MSSGLSYLPNVSVVSCSSADTWILLGTITYHHLRSYRYIYSGIETGEALFQTHGQHRCDICFASLRISGVTLNDTSPIGSRPTDVTHNFDPAGLDSRVRNSAENKVAGMSYPCATTVFPEYTLIRSSRTCPFCTLEMPPTNGSRLSMNQADIDVSCAPRPHFRDGAIGLHWRNVGVARRNAAPATSIGPRPITSVATTLELRITSSSISHHYPVEI